MSVLRRNRGSGPKPRFFLGLTEKFPKGSKLLLLVGDPCQGPQPVFRHDGKHVGVVTGTQPCHKVGWKPIEQTQVVADGWSADAKVSRQLGVGLATWEPSLPLDAVGDGYRVLPLLAALEGPPSPPAGRRALQLLRLWTSLEDVPAVLTPLEERPQ